MSNCCYECKDRVAGCHGKCDKYKTFHVENEKVKQARHEQHIIDDLLKGFNKEKKRNLQHVR